MENAKRELTARVDELDEEEAAQVLDFIGRLSRRRADDELWDRLAGDARVRMPTSRRPGFTDFRPVRVAGEPASETLIRDRR